MKCQDIMSSPAVTCRPGDTLNTAAQLMWENDCGAIPVVGDDESVTGMITDRDICMAAYTQGGSLQTISVWNAMAKQAFCCHANDALDDVERLMSERQVRRVPVVDDSNHAIGMITLNDIARYAASSKKKNGIQQELAQTLAAIGEPRRTASRQPDAQQHHPRA